MGNERHPTGSLDQFDTKRRVLHLLPLLRMAVVCAVVGFLWSFAAGCSDDDEDLVGPGDQLPVDTSSLEITKLHSTGYHANGQVETGLTMQWTLAFESTTGRDCRIQIYRLFDQDSILVHRRDNPTIKYIEHGGELSDKEVWIPIDGPTSSGNYTFTVYYETGRLIDTEDGGTKWNGPLSSGTVSRQFSIDPAA